MMLDYYDQVEGFLAIMLICLLLIQDQIKTLHQKWFVYTTFLLLVLAVLCWSHRPGIIVLISVLFLESMSNLLVNPNTIVLH